MDIRILRFGSLPSTNTEAADQARQGADEGLCVVAAEQTGGRGRQGRAWTSPKGSGVYMSLVLRPNVPPRSLSLLTLMAAVAVYEVLLKSFLLEPDIKWPNDVMVGGRKICGILAETVETKPGLAIVVGIGINLETPDIENATSVKAESQFPATRDEIVQAVTEEISRLYARFLDSPASIVQMWRERSSYGSGLEVRVTLENETFTGTTDGIEENGALRIKLPNRTSRVVQAGDVERLRPA